jgi:hypothetical protein
MRVAEFNEARTFRMERKGALEADGPEIARLAFRGTHGNPRG